MSPQRSSHRKKSPDPLQLLEFNLQYADSDRRPELHASVST